MNHIRQFIQNQEEECKACQVTYGSKCMRKQTAILHSSKLINLSHWLSCTSLPFYGLCCLLICHLCVTMMARSNAGCKSIPRGEHLHYFCVWCLQKNLHFSNLFKFSLHFHMMMTPFFIYYVLCKPVFNILVVHVQLSLRSGLCST